jgi:PglZ domain.
LGYVSEIGKQRDFYSHYVKPLAGKNSRAFVIISDALRYEVAAELCDTITRTTKGTAKLDAVQAVFPSITKFGMAALLPGRKLSVNDSMDVLMDEMPTRSTDERGKILCAANMNSVAVQYTDVLNMKRAERRELVSGKEVVYIYHNTIDAIGDKAPTEKKGV